MNTLLAHSRDFSGLAETILRSGHEIRFRACGNSMVPFVENGDILSVIPMNPLKARIGDVILHRRKNGALAAHRIQWILRDRARPSAVRTRGDSHPGDGEVVPLDAILGQVIQVQRGNKKISLVSRGHRARAALWSAIQPAGLVVYRLARKAGRALEKIKRAPRSA